MLHRGIKLLRNIIPLGLRDEAITVLMKFLSYLTFYMNCLSCGLTPLMLFYKKYIVRNGEMIFSCNFFVSNFNSNSTIRVCNLKLIAIMDFSAMQLNVFTPSGEQRFWFIAFLYVFQCALLITFLDYALKKFYQCICRSVCYHTFYKCPSFIPRKHANTQTLRHIYVHIHQM